MREEANPKKPFEGFFILIFFVDNVKKILFEVLREIKNEVGNT